VRSWASGMRAKRRRARREVAISRLYFIELVLGGLEGHKHLLSESSRQPRLKSSVVPSQKSSGSAGRLMIRRQTSDNRANPTALILPAHMQLDALV
jgi:hypothetical protein